MKFLQTQKHPDCFICPLTGELMENPILFENGFYCDESALTDLMSNPENYSDEIFAIILNEKFVTNYNLKSAISSYREDLWEESKEAETKEESYEIEKDNLLTETAKLESHQYPKEFTCPISGEVMTDPVMTSNGISYQRQNIKKWLSNNNTDPYTGMVLESKELISNQVLQSAIKDYEEKIYQKFIATANKLTDFGKYRESTKILQKLSDDLKLDSNSDERIALCRNRNSAFLISEYYYLDNDKNIPHFAKLGGHAANRLSLLKRNNLLEQSHEKEFLEYASNKKNLYSDNCSYKREQLLLEYFLKCDPTLATTKDHNGNTLLHKIVNISNERLDRKKALIESLLNHGASINEKNNQGETPFFQALTQSYSEEKYQSQAQDFCQYLLNKGCDINAENIKGKNVLQKIYSKKMNESFLQWMFDSGISINHQNKEGKTVLHNVLFVDEKFYQWLLDHGAKTEIRNHEGDTPLDLAKAMKMTSICEMLIKYKKPETITRQKSAGSLLSEDQKKNSESVGMS